MNNEELIRRYNPANAKNLTDQELSDMRELTDEQISTLARAFPNQPQRKAYLVLYDKNVDARKQLYTLSTWQNLRNVRIMANQKQLVAHTFRDLFAPAPRATATTKAKAPGTATKRVSVDLTAEEAANQLRAAMSERQAAPQASGPAMTTVGSPQDAGKVAAKAVAKTPPAPVPAKTTSPKGGGKKGAMTARPVREDAKAENAPELPDDQQELDLNDE